ncbi:leukocyte surface antigen CD53-like isoform X1 [Anarrhichthys ocellatus]|uniref:leukocyte surface antigen CD53-like isoform X1 n=1 Tax=Anarrhichthys ocellatus TaxID=433405 RepID=UPI0012ED426E|nr:leukocyte surface antigen CD53-like isoform X1 [Anarrhichthys ocellatus]XP_031733211.1 leukocyte surface antigen CD53-like isoform X1 [Anarrhichthys ocellatus]
MNRSCVNYLKTMVISLNFLCWLCGAFVVALGEFQVIHSRFASLVTTFWPIFPANTLVVTGTIVTCVCYLGVFGGMKENRCMLINFFVLLFILMLVELAMGCVFLVYSREIDTYFERDLMRSLEIYRQSGPESNTTIKDDFDAVQHLFRCCGVHGVADWKGNIPISCCREDPCNTLIHTNWQEGCLVKLKDWFSRNYRSTGAGVVTMFILQVRTSYFPHCEAQRDNSIPWLSCYDERWGHCMENKNKKMTLPGEGGNAQRKKLI